MTSRFLLFKKLNLIFFAIVSFNSISGQIKAFDNYEKFEKVHILNLNADSIYVINFWATWCVPCVKELPYFEALNEKRDSNKVNVLLVSLDFEEHLESRLLPFIEKKEILSEVVVLTDGNANSWINKVDPSWSGALPATIFLWNGEKHFFEKSYHSLEELENEILKIKQL